jgi:hypothetical protein
VTNRKGQNSILFLTTLGVYLGLVLVGATPQAIAHQRAAMTRNFDIRDEIEFSDDLDTNPDGDRSMIGDSVEVYLQDFEQLLTSLGGLNKKGQFDPATSAFEVSQSIFLPCVPFNQAGSYTAQKFDNANESIKPALERFSKQLTYGYSLGDCVKNDRFSDTEAVFSHFTFKLNKSALSVELTVKKSGLQSAADLIAALPPTFKSERITKNASVIRQKLIESTSFRNDNDQVFIVTRLPRASIDSLFAKDAK